MSHSAITFTTKKRGANLPDVDYWMFGCFSECSFVVGLHWVKLCNSGHSCRFILSDRDRVQLLVFEGDNAVFL